MTRIDFYHYAEGKLRYACRLAATVAERENRLVVFSPEEETLASFDRLLWTYQSTPFVPHCRATDAIAAETPVILASGDEALPHHDVLLTVRDVGKALGLEPLFVEQLAKSLSWWDRHGDLARRFEEEKLAGASHMAGHFMRLVQEILGFPRHLSQHVGGFIITRSPIAALVPVENAAMPDRTVIQWDKYDIEALGLLKVDILALGMLSALRRTFALVRAAHGIDIDMSRIPAEDPCTYAMLSRADTVGVFQVE